MLRTATDIDREAIIEVVVAAGMFAPDEVGIVDDLLREHFAVSDPSDHRCTVVERDGRVTGVAYAAPRPAADGVWELVMLGVRPDTQGRGDGSALIASIEAELAGDGYRLMVVETSASAPYDAARAFYRARGYEEEARVRDYWSDGDDLVVFRKRLVLPRPERS